MNIPRSRALVVFFLTVPACWRSSPPPAPPPQLATRHVDDAVLARCIESVDAWNTRMQACESNPVTRDGFVFPCPPMGVDVLAATACAGLYSQLACRDAWTSTSTATGMVGAPYTEIVRPCAATYCSRLPSPLPAACNGKDAFNVLAELDRAILIYEGVPANQAATLAERRSPYTSVALTGEGP